MKRPARQEPVIKTEPPTPKKKAKPAEAVEKKKAKPAEAVEEKPAAVSCARSEASQQQPAKAIEAAQDKLPAPSKKQWNDMSYTLKALAKKGKGQELAKAWDEAKGKGQQAKRQFYYNVFLLDPETTRKSVEKESLEKLSREESTVKGWVTKWEAGKMMGADPSLPNFESLCDLAVEGLPERAHEVPKWAQAGIKQYHLEKVQLAKETQSNESLTKAKQAVEIESAEDFEKAEKSLMADPSGYQVLLGGKKPKAVEQAEVSQPPEQAWEGAFKGLQKVVKAFATAVDKMLLLRKTLEPVKAKRPSSQLEASLEALTKLEEKHSDSKQHWAAQLARFGDLPANQEAQEDETRDMETARKACDEAVKELNKAVSPHRLWAHNEGIL